MTTTLGRVGVSDEGNSPMMPHDPLTTWSREVMWQIKSLISPISQSLSPPNLIGTYNEEGELIYDVT